MFSNDRTQIRQFYYHSWQRYNNNETLDPLAQQIVAVIKEHPEYHTLLNNERILQQDYFPEMGETNPFLHMGMHLGLREQLATQRPLGIQTIYQQLCQQMSQHNAEHEMMDCLAEAIWSAQREQRLPDEPAYLQCLQAKIQQQNS